MQGARHDARAISPWASTHPSSPPRAGRAILCEMRGKARAAALVAHVQGVAAGKPRWGRVGRKMFRFYFSDTASRGLASRGLRLVWLFAFPEVNETAVPELRKFVLIGI